MAALGAILNAIINLVANLFKPINRVFAAIVGIVATLLGAFADPQGAVNAFVCRIIDLVAFALPSTPEYLKIGTLLQSVGSAIPIVGYGVVLEIFRMAMAFLVIVLLIKLYKLIPFKAS